MRGRSIRTALLCAGLAAAGLGGLLPVAAHAATIGYWRMEVDLDPSANGLEVANEFATGSPLTSSEAFVDSINNPNPSIPQTGSLNQGSLGATIQGGSNGLNGTVAWYPALDVSSISVEFWARTPESNAELFSRTSGGADGIILDSPNSLDIVYHVDDGAGGSQAFQLDDLANMSTAWHHYAFLYDEVTGEASFFVDNVRVGYFDGPDNRPLVWGTQVDLRIGTRMDYAGAGNGILDEFRIDGTALAREDLLMTPEPGSGLLAGLGVAGLAWARRRSRAGRRR